MAPNTVTIISAIIQVIVMIIISRRCLILSRYVVGKDKMILLTGAGAGAFIVVWSVTTALTTLDFYFWQAGNAFVRIVILLIAFTFLQLLGRRIAPVK